MQLALLDLPASLDHALHLSFPQPGPLDSVDVLVWQPAAITGVYGVEGTHLGRPVLGVADSQRLVKDSRFWRDEFRAFIGRGGTLVMLAPGHGTLGIHTVQDVVGYDFIEALPDHAGLRRTERAPAAVACTVGEPFRSFFDAIGERFAATAEFDAANAQPIATVAGTERVCALYQYRHPGRVIVLPALAPSVPAAAVDGIVRAIADMASRLRFEGSAPSSSPAWKTSFDMPGESALRRRLAELAAQRRALDAEHDTLARQLSDLAFLRQLHDGDAVGALDAAALVLHALGAYAQKGGAGTDTVLFELDGRTGVLVAVDDALRALGEGLAAHVRRRAQAWSRELRVAVVPVTLYVAGNRRGIAQTGEEIERLRLAHPSLTFIAGSDLQQAYDARDAGLVGRWLDAAEAAHAGGAARD
ncbi:hypothetical protein [Variovorax sp. PBL-E5]|uniref:hypothetical protein n=1 Tax=Variovorax sp. PBL-E5 TaxID=434014 RepID=UPI001315B974|nr:hypothetical protein [Variovorax sp. PBL-E5]VTU24078.1 hypothetical protein E5CHR_01720 [Variovorax sp. PBL-E5]